MLILNPIAEQLTGWTLKEFVGRPIDEVFHIMNALTKEKIKNPAQRVFEAGTVIESTHNTLLISKDGIERPIEDSAAPIKDEQRVFII